MTTQAILALASTVFVFSLKPGPGITTAMSYALADGFKGLLTFLVGFNIGLGIYLTIVFIGLETLNLDMVFIAILAKAIAAVFLIYIGGKGLLDSEVDISAKEVTPDDTFRRIIGAMMLTMSNPMIIIFYAALIPVFIKPENLTIGFEVFLALMIMAIDSFGMVIYCTPLILFKKTLPANFGRVIKIISSVIIILIGLYIGYTAMPAKDLMAVF